MWLITHHEFYFYLKLFQSFQETHCNCSFSGFQIIFFRVLEKIGNFGFLSKPLCWKTPDPSPIMWSQSTSTSKSMIFVWTRPLGHPAISHHLGTNTIIFYLIRSINNGFGPIRSHQIIPFVRMIQVVSVNVCIGLSYRPIGFLCHCRLIMRSHLNF